MYIQELIVFGTGILDMLVRHIGSYVKWHGVISDQKVFFVQGVKRGTSPLGCCDVLEEYRGQAHLAAVRCHS